MSGRYGQILSRLIHTDRTKLSHQCPTSSGYEPPEHEGGYKIYRAVFLFAGKRT